MDSVKPLKSHADLDRDSLLARERETIHTQILEIESELEAIYSARLFRVAQSLVTAARSPRAFLKLPASIIRALRPVPNSQSLLAPIEYQRDFTQEDGPDLILRSAMTDTPSEKKLPRRASAKRKVKPRRRPLKGLGSPFPRPGPAIGALSDRLRLRPSSDGLYSPDEHTIGSDPVTSDDHAWKSLPATGLQFRIPTDEAMSKGGYHLLFDVDLRIDGNLEPSGKECIAAIRFYQGHALVKPAQPLPSSRESGDYLYLPIVNQGGSFDIVVPKEAEWVEVILRPHSGAKIEYRGEIRVEILKPGIGVVIPTYRGKAHIGRCLNALAAQTLSPHLFEIIIVPNGEPDGSLAIIETFIEEHPDISVTVIPLSVSGASRARNAGLDHLSRAYGCLLDDDDTFAPATLEAMLDVAAPHRMVLTPMVDIKGTETLEDTVINRQIMSQSGLQAGDITYRDVTSALSTNAGKCVPTSWLASTRFNETLGSGEDVVFWANLLMQYRPDIAIITHNKAGQPAAYERFLRDGSLSRRDETFAFMVEERLDVVARLDDLAADLPDDQRSFLYTKIRAQAMFVVRYLQKNPERRSDVMREVRRRNVDFPVQGFINGRLTDDLYISFCFPPFVDTAAVVVAKRINNMAVPIDVISNAMYRTRNIDTRLLKLAEDHVGELNMLDAPESFGHWGAMETFADLAVDAVQERERRLGPYKRVFTRVLWPAANFAAALLKVRRPELFWSAEFSDPVRKDIHGVDRPGDIDMEWLASTGLLDAIRHSALPVPTTSSLFAWCEYLPYILADELIFTNPLQRDYMLGYIAEPEIRAEVMSKSVIRPQPTFDPQYYELAPAAYQLDDSAINIGYFGAFYATRGFGAVLSELKSLPEPLRARIKLHIFTGQSEAITELEDYPLLEDSLSVNPYVPYLEFLNLSKRFDLLLVNDAETINSKPVNPYLPSKLSDYAGSGRRIWCLYEPGSTMDMLTRGTDILRTEMTDGASIRKALLDLVQ